MAVMYSKLGGCFGETAKLGPLARTDLWTLVKGLLERLMTHFGLGSSLGEELWGLLCLLERGRLCFQGASTASHLGNTGLGGTWLGGLAIWPRDNTVSQGCATCLGIAWLPACLPCCFGKLVKPLAWLSTWLLGLTGGSLPERPHSLPGRQHYLLGKLGVACLGNCNLCLGESTVHWGSWGVPAWETEPWERALSAREAWEACLTVTWGEAWLPACELKAVWGGSQELGLGLPACLPPG